MKKLNRFVCSAVAAMAVIGMTFTACDPQTVLKSFEDKIKEAAIDYAYGVYNDMIVSGTIDEENVEIWINATGGDFEAFKAGDVEKLLESYSGYSIWDVISLIQKISNGDFAGLASNARELTADGSTVIYPLYKGYYTYDASDKQLYLFVEEKNDDADAKSDENYSSVDEYKKISTNVDGTAVTAAWTSRPSYKSSDVEESDATSYVQKCEENIIARNDRALPLLEEELGKGFSISKNLECMSEEEFVISADGYTARVFASKGQAEGYVSIGLIETENESVFEKAVACLGDQDFSIFDFSSYPNLKNLHDQLKAYRNDDTELCLAGLNAELANADIKTSGEDATWSGIEVTFKNYSETTENGTYYKYGITTTPERNNNGSADISADFDYYIWYKAISYIQTVTSDDGSSEIRSDADRKAILEKYANIKKLYAAAEEYLEGQTASTTN